MTLREHPAIEQGSEAWHDQRRGLVTASVVGRLITAKTLKPAENDYSRALTEQLVAERITGWTEPTYMNDDMMRGVLSEPIARAAYAQHYGVKVDETGFMVRTFYKGLRLGYSPDGLVGSDGLLEIKAPRAKNHLHTILTDEVPAIYMPQLQAGLLVSGRPWIDFVSYVGGMPLYRKRVEPDENWHDAILAAVEKFELNAARMVAAYKEATQGLAQTERLVFEDVVI